MISANKEKTFLLLKKENFLVVQVILFILLNVMI
jgi:hypothetical protein